MSGVAASDLPAKGIAALEARAKAGDREAQWKLGGLYLSDDGAVQNLAKGFAWTKSAAMLGHVSAQHKLGTLYLAGRGTRADPKAARDWLAKASAAGDLSARRLLANLDAAAGAAATGTAKKVAPVSATSPRKQVRNGVPWLHDAAFRGLDRSLAGLVHRGVDLNAPDAEPFAHPLDPDLVVLTVTTTAARLASMLELAGAIGAPSYLAFNAVPGYGAYMHTPPPLPELATEPWQRQGHAAFLIGAP